MKLEHVQEAIKLSQTVDDETRPERIRMDAQQELDDFLWDHRDEILAILERALS